VIYVLHKERFSEPGGRGPRSHCPVRNAKALVPSKIGV